ncbi:hypothetical protein C5C59_01035 [Rathayibacter sp. AY1F4]|nr:hypothetical protein C5C26_11950 [Rathayibacter sp. AY2B1]PPG73669.1 hypothetical protein C5C59_01035 [Rathayibacter sp. AY1F4]
MPSAPAAPAAPVAPTAPVAPVAPTAPVAPVAPAAPSAARGCFQEAKGSVMSVLVVGGLAASSGAGACAGASTPRAERRPFAPRVRAASLSQGNTGRSRPQNGRSARGRTTAGSRPPCNAQPRAGHVLGTRPTDEGWTR